MKQYDWHETSDRAIDVDDEFCTNIISVKSSYIPEDANNNEDEDEDEDDDNDRDDNNDGYLKYIRLHYVMFLFTYLLQKSHSRSQIAHFGRV